MSASSGFVGAAAERELNVTHGRVIYAEAEGVGWFLGFGIFFVACGALLGAALSTSRSPILILTGSPIALVPVAGGMALATYYWRRGTNFKEVRSGAVVERHRRRIKIVVYNESLMVWRSVVTHYINFVKGETRRTITVGPARDARGNVTFEVKHESDFDRLTEWFDNLVMREVMPPRVAAIERGETVQFNGIGVSRWGVEHGKRKLLWSDLAFVLVKEGKLRVHTFNKQRQPRQWFEQELTTAPNLVLLLALLGRRVEVRGQGASWHKRWFGV